MRIISGHNKGRRITAPSKLPVRPTTDMAKEALFNILRNHFDFEGLKVLDLFAGIGSISYEFASLDAAEVQSVELNSKCASFISETSRKIGLDKINVIRANAFTYLSRGGGKKFDIIFADPPYDLEGIQEIPNLVFEKNMLEEGGWLIIEHSENIDFSNHPRLDQKRKYGKVNFSIFSIDKLSPNVNVSE